MPADPTSALTPKEMAALLRASMEALRAESAALGDRAAS